MRCQSLSKLLDRKVGYETVFLLLQCDKQRTEIVDYVNVAGNKDSSGGTLTDWLIDAEIAGLISSRTEIIDGKREVVYSLNFEFSSEKKDIIRHRGGRGGRAVHGDHADVPHFSHWDDDYTNFD